VTTAITALYIVRLVQSLPVSQSSKRNKMPGKKYKGSTTMKKSKLKKPTKKKVLKPLKNRKVGYGR
tara:strand:+ start:688 stop:885 length:198 start_codon:yes stop_codon:yes gene_type:complete